MFTTNQIEEIRKRLQLEGAKDTSFPDASAIKGNEILALVQEGVNKKMTLKEFAKFISKFVPGGSGEGGGGYIDPSVFDAAIKAYESEVATASVSLEDGVFNFEVGLPKGPQGIQGPQGNVGPRGVQGPQGPKGDPGDVAVSSYPAMVFRNAATKPDKPSGGSWNALTNTFIYPNGWGPTDNLPRPVWMSTKTFYADSSLDGQWSDPIQVSGDDGEKGADGTTTEFMYKLSEDVNDKPTIPTDQSQWTPEGDDWTDDPTGIDEGNQCEWVIVRNVLDDGSWSDWKGPTIWSMWGTMGQDGAGVEYVYYLDNTGIAPDNPTPTGDLTTNEEYQDTTKEYQPKDTNWKDNPTGVSPTMQYEWVAVRKRRDNLWGPYSKPALWAHYGEHGKSGYLSRTMYASTNSTTEVPSYNPDTVAQPSHWLLTFPSDYNEDTVVWAIDAYINVEGELVGEWTPPRIITGIKGSIDVPITYNSTYYTYTSAVGVTPNAPTIGMDYDSTITSLASNGETCTWIDAPTDGAKQWYQCVATINSETRKIIDWSAVAVWNGRDGVTIPGKYWDVRVAITDSLDTPPAINKTSPNPNQGITSAPWMVVTKDSVFTIPEGGRMWETRAQFNEDGTFASGGWCTPYPISGERGPKGETGPTGPQGPASPSGVPGVSYEERYMRGDENGPSTNWIDANVNNRYPTGWELTIPKGINQDFPYIWCIKARIIRANNDDTVGNLEDGWEGPFRMSGINGTNADPVAPTTIGVLTNPTDTVVCDTNGNVITGLPIETTLRIFDGDGEKNVLPTSFGYEVLNTSNNNISITSNPNTATITITNLALDAPKAINIKVYGKASKEGVEYYQIFTLRKLTTNDLPVQADLANDSTSVSADSDGKLLLKELYNTFYMYVGTSPQPLTALQLTDRTGSTVSKPAGVTFTATKNNATNLYTGEFGLYLKDEAFNADTITLYIAGTCEYEGKIITRVVPFRISRIRGGKDSTWYELNTSVPVIVRDKLNDGTLSDNIYPTSLAVNVKKHVGDTIETLSVEKSIEEGLTISVIIDNDTANQTTLSTTSLDLSTIDDLEEMLVLNLKKGTTLLDSETLPVVTNGLGASSYKLSVSHDVVQYGLDQVIYNIEPDANGNKYIYCNVILERPNENPININNESLKKQYLSGFDLKLTRDGITEDYTPGTKILANSAQNNFIFELIYVLGDDSVGSGDRDIIYDYETIPILKPQVGNRGQMVYPAGTYNVDATYTTTEKVAPYVYDALAQKFYVLNAVMDWTGNEQEEGFNTPSTNYNDGQNPNAVWEPFDMYEAVYADIGVFNQAYVGSAVFWKHFVFSQQGVDNYGKADTNYENFGITTSGSNLLAGVPTPETIDLLRNDLKFYPNVCFNFKTGECWLGQNKIRMSSDGAVSLSEFRVVKDGLVYDIDDNSYIYIGSRGIYMRQNNTLVWNLDKTGRATFAKSNIVFNADGSGYIGKENNQAISWTADGDTIRFGNSDIVFRNGKMYSASGVRGMFEVNSSNNNEVDVDSYNRAFDFVFTGLPSNNKIRVNFVNIVPLGESVYLGEFNFYGSSLISSTPINITVDFYRNSNVLNPNYTQLGNSVTFKSNEAVNVKCYWTAQGALIKASKIELL